MTSKRLFLLRGAAVAAGATTLVSAALAQAPTEYRLSFPDVVHHVMHVEATFHTAPRQALQLQMSRSSPGRYAAFEFAANVFQEQFTDGAGKPLPVTRVNPRTWSVTSADGTVHAAYNIFGDKVDGTFLAIDTSHAHINFPSAVMWAQGMEDRASRVTFTLPANLPWKIATQLYPTDNAQTFTAPNLQYLMDSPAELSNFTLHAFQVPSLTPGGKAQTIRVSAHSQSTPAELDDYFSGVEKLVREEQAVFGELPDYEPGAYTFLSDALPWDGGDGMEHRNSTVITGRRLNLPTVAHEFFHNWNVERIRPQGLEPFNFRDVNMSGEMFVAEGFTQYYGQLAMLRAGLTPATELRGFAGDITRVLTTPGTGYRSAMDMSRMAPFVDGSPDDFPKYMANTFVSYYTFGDAIALGLDLTLRARSGSRITLDDLMRAMWRVHGKPGGPAPGLVGKPYTVADVETQLASVSGDKAFAADFVSRYIRGTEKIDYAPLLLRAGFLLRRHAGPATLGPLRMVKADGGLRVESSSIIGTPAYLAGLDRGDTLQSVDGTAVAAPEDVTRAIAAKKAGDSVQLVFKRRDETVTATATLAEPTALEIVPVEAATADQKQFREAWLGSKAK